MTTELKGVYRKAKFMAEIRAQQEREDEEKLKLLSPKERDEWRKTKTKLSGTSRAHVRRGSTHSTMHLLRPTTLRKEP